MPIVRALLGLVLGCAMGVATAYLRHYWRRARWVRNHSGNWLVGWISEYPDWFILHLGFGFLEWGEFPITGVEPPAKQVTYLRPRWMR